MTSDRAAMNGDYDEEFWREFLTRGKSGERRVRAVYKHIPHDPRCKLCAAPFGGAGAPVMRLIGKRPAEQNPNVCRKCFTFLSSHHGGAEIDVTMLFADIRGSTTLAEGMSTADFRRLLDRFYTTASGVVFAHDGMVDKFVGDELVANFFPLLAGERHAIKGLDAARDLLRQTGHEEPAGPWVPLGVGVHTARTWFGAVGRGGHVELTALGDAVNTTARLASLATAGEILITIEAATAAALDLGSLDRQQLELRGKHQTIDVVRLRVGPADAIAAA
jgi:adenylate cyclase